LAVYSPNEKECLDRENIFQQCILGKTVPQQYWKEWKLCEKSLAPNSDPSIECVEELEKYVEFKLESFNSLTMIVLEQLCTIELVILP
jgi:hypothetical protein